MPGIKCGPKVNGVRQSVSNQCSERCPFYEMCMSELKTKRTKKFVERDPTENELENFVGHISKNGDIKVWDLVPLKQISPVNRSSKKK